MVLEYLTRLIVRKIVFQLKEGDRFEKDLITSIEDLTEKPEEEFQDIRENLLELGLVYKLRGGQGSPYLALSDLGQVVVNRLYEIEDILKQSKLSTLG
ncbi:MAG: hypothetical protein ACW98Y_01275 [Candidatus Thorarchaeota archaeon]|jgi:hypothetical protein